MPHKQKPTQGRYGRESHAAARGIIDNADLTLLEHLIVPVLR